MMRKIFTVAVMLFVLICSAAAPASWQSDPHRARSLSRSRDLPVLIVFAGSMDNDTAVLKDKLEKLIQENETKKAWLDHFNKKLNDVLAI